MSHTYAYIGCFISEEDLQSIFRTVGGSRLDRVIAYPHVTFSYRPGFVDESLFGEVVSIRITGYGNNGSNEGVKVELSAKNAAVSDMIAQIEVPHITLSVSEDSKPVYTNYLSFTPVMPFEITGIFGGFTTDRHVITEQ